MSLPNYLAKIKSSGIYRFVWDKSEITATDAETLRLVVGYSEKGPFNTPVYIDNPGDFVTIFGGVNKKLEKRGVFFHRMALQALTEGPILCLNLKKFTESSGNDAERISYATVEGVGRINTGTGKAGDGKSGLALVKQVYDTSRFWTIEPDNLNKLVSLNSAQLAGSTQYITIASTDSVTTSNSFFMRPCIVPGYDVTVKTWYATTGEEMPEYFVGYENMLISDFFAEIYVFKGEFTASVAQTPELKKYFDVTFDSEGKASITLKPYIVNAFGQKVDTLDALASNECSNFIQKYQGIVLPNFKNANGTYISLDLIFNSDYNNHKMIMKFNSERLDDNEEFTVDNLDTRGWDQIVEEDILALAGTVADGHKWDNLPTVLGNCQILPSINATYFDTDKTIKHGELVKDATELKNIDNSVDYELTYVVCDMVKDNSLGYEAIKATGDLTKMGLAKGDRFIVSDSSKPAVATLSDLVYKDDYTYLTFVREDGKPDFEPFNLTGECKITEFKDKQAIVRCNKTLTTIGNMSPIYLAGYTPNPATAKPAANTVVGKRDWQKSILNAIHLDSSIGYPGLVEALTNRTDIDYRYIVDTFESFPDLELKSTLALIAKQKDNCMLLTNFPSIKTFSQCSSFTDDHGNFHMKYVKDGYNKSKFPDVQFSLPSEENGASWCSFNTPVLFTDGTVKTIVPSAALVSNNFMKKYAGRQPYYIVAGPNYGRLTYNGLVGPDCNFSRADLDILEPMGVNAIVYVPRKGTYINSNQTAKQNPVTALSKINVRELVIYLQDQIEDLLQKYQWEFNTQSLRDVVKAKADTICENIQANNGIYAFRNQCDELNNTDEVINNEMLVLSTFIEPGMGAGKMVQELTIYKKGGMTSVIK